MSNYIKYPRTFHLPWSEGYTEDDKVLTNVDHFIGKDVIVSEKLDGENSSLYRDHIHARSTDSKDHESRHWLKNFHSIISYNIPEGWRFCGENLFAKHSIHYKELTSYFYLFSIWNESNICLSWDDTIEWANLLEIELVPVLYRGTFDEKLIKSLYTKNSLFNGEQEGYVVRIADSYHYDDFKYNVGKFVRKNHVQTGNHWLNSSIIPNDLRI